MGPEDFILHLQRTGHAATARPYGIAVRSYEAWLADRRLPRDAVPEGVLDQFATYLAPRVSPSSVAVYTRAVRKYTDFLRAHGERIPKLQAPKIPRGEVLRVLSPDALRRYALQAAAAAEPYRTILLLVALVPVKIKDLVALSRADVVTGRGRRSGAQVWFVTRSDDRRAIPRRVPLVPAARRILHTYFTHVRPDLGSARWIFPSRSQPGQPVHPKTVTKLVETIKRRGVLVTPEALYRTALAELARAGVDGVEIAEIAGVRFLDTTRALVARDDDKIYSAASRVPDSWLKGIA